MANNKGRRAGKSYKNYYDTYKFKESSQRKARLEKHLKKQPNDEQAKKALENGPTRRRKTPKVKGGYFQESYHRPYIFALEGANRPLDIGPSDRRIISQETALSEKVKRKIKHGDKRLKQMSKDTTPRSNYQFEEEHKASVSSKNAQKKKKKKSAKA